YRDYVNALARQGVQVGGQGCHQRLSFTRAHFGNAPGVQGNATHELHIEMTHAKHALAGFADYRKGLGQQGIQRLAVGVALAKLCSLRLQLVVGKSGDFRFERIDACNLCTKLLEQPVVPATEYFLEQVESHLRTTPARWP